MKHKEEFEAKLLAQKKSQQEEWFKVASVAKQKAEVEMKTKQLELEKEKLELEKQN